MSLLAPGGYLAKRVKLFDFAGSTLISFPFNLKGAVKLLLLG